MRQEWYLREEKASKDRAMRQKWYLREEKVSKDREAGQKWYLRKEKVSKDRAACRKRYPKEETNIIYRTTPQGPPGRMSGRPRHMKGKEAVDKTSGLQFNKGMEDFIK